MGQPLKENPAPVECQFYGRSILQRMEWVTHSGKIELVWWGMMLMRLLVV